MFTKYKITANLLCGDVRLNMDISTVVETVNAPGEDEAEIMLAPVAEEILSAPAYRCGGCQYYLSNFKIRRLAADEN